MTAWTDSAEATLARLEQKAADRQPFDPFDLGSLDALALAADPATGIRIDAVRDRAGRITR